MRSQDATPRTAEILFRTTMAISVVGIFAAIFFVFDDVKTAIDVASFSLVGLVGVLSYLRHSVFYLSDQARMGWFQDRAEFQKEVGFANLAVGIAAIVAVSLDLGLLANAMCLLMYGTYLACAGTMHAVAFMKSTEEKKSPAKVINFAIFAGALIGFAIMALTDAGAL